METFMLPTDHESIPRAFTRRNRVDSSTALHQSASTYTPQTRTGCGNAKECKVKNAKWKGGQALHLPFLHF
jgi:7-cyano-7-deazaguanine synthase in queuosine biosynthesis